MIPITQDNSRSRIPPKSLWVDNKIHPTAGNIYSNSSNPPIPQGVAIKKRVTPFAPRRRKKAEGGPQRPTPRPPTRTGSRLGASRLGIRARDLTIARFSNHRLPLIGSSQDQLHPPQHHETAEELPQGHAGAKGELRVRWGMFCGRLFQLQAQLCPVVVMSATSRRHGTSISPTGEGTCAR